MNFHYTDKNDNPKSFNVKVFIENDTYVKTIQETVDFAQFKNWTSGGSATGTAFDDTKTTYSNNVISLHTDGFKFVSFTVRGNISFMNDENDYIVGDNVVYTSAMNSKLNDYVLKSELPTDHVTTSSLTNTPSDYTKNEVTEALSTQVSRWMFVHSKSDRSLGYIFISTWEQKRESDVLPALGVGTPLSPIRGFLTSTYFRSVSYQRSTLTR